MDPWDFIRLLDIVIGVAVEAEIVRAVFIQWKTNGMSRWQSARFLALFIAVLQVLITEYLRLHHNGTWHTWLNLIIVVVAAYGCWGLISRRDRATPNVR